ncbi:MAG: LamG domain-containing protein [Deltaproteobacteria bacterium]|nr:LamG domain-containing protein [Deltaproteobacteria bacterium]
MRTEAIVVMGTLVASSCGNADAFVCTADGQCGGDGACEASGYCSFLDDTCMSGRRYGDLAGALSGMCVGGGSTSDTGDSTTSGSSTTTSSSGPDPDGGSTSPSTTSSTTGLAETTSSGTDCDPVVGWWDCRWRARIPLEVLPPDGPLPQVPVGLFLDPMRIDYGLTGPGGVDLRVVAADGTTELPIEVDRWEHDGDSIVWFRIDDLDPRSTSMAWVYFDNPDAVAAGTAAAVWSNGYRAVWHLDGELADSVQAVPDCVDEGVLSVSGLFGEGQAPVRGGWADCGQVGLEGLFVGGGTITAWVNPDDGGGSGSGRIVDKSGSAAPQGYALAVTANERIQFARGHVNGLGLWRTPLGSVPFMQWSHVAVAYVETGMGVPPQMHVDGVLQGLSMGSAPGGSVDAESEYPLAIGNNAPTGGRTFNGVIDEVRLSDGIRTPTWIAYEHEIGRDNVVSYGGVEVLN